MTTPTPKEMSPRVSRRCRPPTLRAGHHAQGRDRARERAVLVARHRDGVQQYEAAREAYAMALRDTRQEWFESLDAERVAAVEALRDAAAAVESLRRWSGVTAGARAPWP